jgi:hypothetical protein
MNWPGSAQWFNDIGGYHVFEIDPLTNAESFLRDIGNPGQRVIAVPLPWGARCYGVRAYSADPALESSAMSTYCPGDPPTPQTLSLAPSAWITAGGQWIQDGDCDTYGGADYYLLDHNQHGFGNEPGEVLVGSYLVDDDDADCFRQGDYSGGVRFDLFGIPQGAVLHQARLTYASWYTDYHASGVATNYTLLCVGGVGRALQDWTGLGGPDHFHGNNILRGYAWQSPIASLPDFALPEVDVTAAVGLWMNHPQQNHGLILTPRNAPHPAVDGSGSCMTNVEDVRLHLELFVP